MMRRIARLPLTTLLLLAGFCAQPAPAEDWPMWRFDSARSAASPEQLPDKLELLWSRQFAPRTQTWDDSLNLDLMTYDRVFEPIVLDGRMFVGFNDRDKLVAYDVESGAELWSYFAEGPVRLPPVGWQGKVYFTSDDGYLYCVSAADGQLRWRFQGAPGGRLALGNKRLASAWPARGGPVLRDGRVYFSASIWPFMGVFIYALDATTGEIAWVSDDTGSQYIRQPHSAPSFAGVAPQGALVATEDVLLVPGGRSVPAAFDRHSGKFMYFEINAGGKGTGGSFVAANDESFFVHTRDKGTREFAIATGVKTAFQVNEPVLAGDRIYSAEFAADRPVIRAYDRAKKLVWELPADGRGDLILAGNTLYAAGRAAGPTATDGGPAASTAGSTPRQGTLAAIRVRDDQRDAELLWTVPTEGEVERLFAASGKLFAVTADGRITAYAANETGRPGPPNESSRPLQPSSDDAQTAGLLLQAGDAEGYALWFGAANERLVEAVAAQSPFVQLAVVDSDADRVRALRGRLDAAGLYGQITMHLAPADEFLAPPYIAQMVFVGAELTPQVLAQQGLLARIYESVRPYGGVLHLLAQGKDGSEIERQVASLGLEQARVEASRFGVVIRRVGALPGSADWTHQHGNVANTIKSDDKRVKLPLGILWYGGSSNADVLPRHGHGPPEQVVGGRLFIQGMDMLSARDVYTGRILWQRKFENLGTYDVFYDETYKDTPLDTAYNQVHIPGANARGTNYVVTADRLYIVEGNVCRVLDPATGDSIVDIALPQQDPLHPNEWGFIGVYQDVLIGGVGFAKYGSRHDLPFVSDAALNRNRAGFGSKSLDRAASVSLVGFDRHSGQQLWKVDALHSFWHNGIVAGNGLVYALDKNPKPVEDMLRRRGISNPDTYRILAFDVRTGEKSWETREGIFGTWLGYSEAHDLLLQAGAAGSDRLLAEVPQGMAVYRGKDGSQVWRNDSLSYAGPCILHNDLIITNVNSNRTSAGAFHLQDGSQKMVPNPLTGALQPWAITRAYGCNSIIASENMLTFRSGAAGFYDLLNDGGTGNFGGFKSGCTSNLVVANGVLNAPDYTRTCSCAYQNQTSLALVHMPDVETWTVDNAAVLRANERVQRVGINVGAPGDRRDQLGLLWLEYPIVAGDSPLPGIEFEGEAKFYQDHSTTMAGTPLPWVLSSGVEGITGMRLRLRAEAPDSSGKRADKGTKADSADPPHSEPQAYRMRLFFGAPRSVAGKPRAFGVSVPGQPSLPTVTLEGAGSYAIRTLERVVLDEWLEVHFLPEQGSPLLSGIEIQRLDR